jgi:hypothetical protein
MKTRVLSLLFALAIVAYADNYDSLMIESGIDKQFSQFAEQIIQGMENGIPKDGGSINTPTFLKYVTAVKASLSDSELKKGILSYLKKTIPVNQIDSLLIWYRSPLGKKITLAEIEVSDPQNLESALNYVSDNVERKDQIIQLLAELGANDLATELALQMAIATAYTVNLINKKTTAIEYNQIAAIFSKQRDQIFQTVKAANIATSLYAYRNISDDGINLYIKFSQSPLGKKFNTTVLKALKEILTRQIKSIPKNYK